MNPHPKELLHHELTYKIIGILYKVHSAIGPGFNEKIYQKAMEIELKEEGIPYESEKEFKVVYHNEIIGKYRLDLVIDEKVIVELKAVERLPKVFKEQLLSYLKASPYEVGLLVNFGAPKLEYVRMVREKERREDANG